MNATRIALWMCGIGFLTALGCSNGPPAAKLTGKITYKGQPVKGGTIYLKYEGSQASETSTGIRPDGTYTFSDMPLGQARVCIETESYNPQGEKPVYGRNSAKNADDRMKNANSYAEAMGKAGPDAKQAKASGGLGGPNAAELAKLYVKIPAKYANEKTSGLSVTIEQGMPPKDFDLTD